MNHFEKQLVKGIREMPDEAIILAVKGHINKVLEISETLEEEPEPKPRSQPKKKKKTESVIIQLGTEVIHGKMHHNIWYKKRRYLMWRVRDKICIQDEETRRQKAKPKVKVFGKNEIEVRNALRAAV